MREAFSEFWTDSGGSRSADASPVVKKVKPLRRRYPRAICTRDGHSDSLINRMMDGGVSPGRVPPPPPTPPTGMQSAAPGPSLEITSPSNPSNILLIHTRCS